MITVHISSTHYLLIMSNRGKNENYYEIVWVQIFRTSKDHRISYSRFVLGGFAEF